MSDFGKNNSMINPYVKGEIGGILFLMLGLLDLVLPVNIREGRNK